MEFRLPSCKRLTGISGLEQALDWCALMESDSFLGQPRPKDQLYLGESMR